MKKVVWGQLSIINLYGCNKKLFCNKGLKDFSNELCKVIGMKSYGNPIIKKFGKGKMHGYSMIQFIETSTITLHTDDIKGKVFVDIFSCKKFSAKDASKFSRKFFGAQKALYKTINRY